MLYEVITNRFSDVYARERTPAGSGFVLAGVGHAFVKFLECYVWKLGVLDGVPGLIIAMNSSWYVFLKHAKRWERNIVITSYSIHYTKLYDHLWMQRRRCLFKRLWRI